MKAIVRIKSGKEFTGIEVLDVPIPEPKENEVLIKIAAARVNPVDMDLMKGMPGLSFAPNQIVGVDGAGTIQKLGQGVNGFAIGDKVFFYRLFTHIGSWAEFVTVPADWLAKVPSEVDLKSVASISLPLLTAFESLKALNLKPDESVLIHGAGGGVGFCAVQFALTFGAKVYATASGKDLEELKNLGVHHVVDYKEQRFDQMIKQGEVDAVLDVLGGETLLRSIALKPKRIVSLHFMDLNQMPKSGMKVNLLFRLLIPMLMKKFKKSANQNGVILLGQVTGANGKKLQEAADLFFGKGGKVKTPQIIGFSEIAKGGLKRRDIGKIIVP
jgi:NADPH:quinone reductase-like Zn-dependent oxidoreductase